MVPEEQIHDYRRGGYILLKSLLDTSDLEPIKKRFISFVSNSIPFKLSSLKSKKWVNFAENNPQLISNLYDQMINDQTLLDLGKSYKITNVIKKLISAPGLYKKLVF